MTAITLLSAEATTRRALQLDALAAILPMDPRDQLAKILTDDDVATLRHLAKESIGENSLRAFAYLEARAVATAGSPLPWAAPEALALKFVAHHVWDSAQREGDPAHGMPADIATTLREKGHLRSAGSHALAPLKRRLVHWATLHRGKGILGPFAAPPCAWQRSAAPAQEPARRHPHDFGSAARHLRSGYLTEAARNGVSLSEAMQQSQHRSVQQAASYDNDADRHLS